MWCLADLDMALTARPVRAGRLGLLSASSFAVFLAVVVALHFVQSELHPFKRFVSEYAVGRMGWLLNAGFAFFAFGLSALAIAFRRDRRLSSPCASEPTARSLSPAESLGLATRAAVSRHDVRLRSVRCDRPRAADLSRWGVRLVVVGRPRASDRVLRGGYFSDPDGHLWEVAWNPAWELD